MLRLICLLVFCLALSQSSETAAIATDSIPNATATPLSVPNLTTTTTTNSSSITCESGYSSRSLVDIVQSCLLTIFACVWVAVHRNIPGPKQTPLAVHLTWLGVVFLAVLVPEWILAWALRQFLKARELATKLEAARQKAQNALENAGQEISAREPDDGASSDEDDDAESKTACKEITRRSGSQEHAIHLMQHWALDLCELLLLSVPFYGADAGGYSRGRREKSWTNEPS